MEMSVQMPDAHRCSSDNVEVYQPFLGLDPDEFKALSRKILIQIPHRPSEGINAALFRNAGMWGFLGTPFASVADEFDGFVELTRAAMVNKFLEFCKDWPECEYLVMIDNDERVHWDAPYRLAQWGKDIVSGIVCSNSRTKGGTFACIIAEDKHGVGRFPTIQRTKKLPIQGLREIKGAGTGLMCVHKRVFEALLEKGEHPFEIPLEMRRHAMSTGTLKQGEDIAFCEKAKAAGFKLYVDFSVRAGHFKTQEILWPDAAVDPALSPQEWEVSCDDFVHT